MTPDDTGGALVCTLGDLSRDTARIMAEIEAAGKPAFITRHGRFIATIIPLEPGEVESRVLSDGAGDRS